MDTIALIPAAFFAGLLMFLAPCTLPIVPGYLAFISGSAGDAYKETGGGAKKRKVLINAIAFVVGFSAVFIVLGTFAARLGGLLGPWRDTLGHVAGALIILFGLTMLGVVRIPAIQTERRFALPHFLRIGRFESSLLIGILFALGWSPCIGPILGSILLLASGSATAGQGAFLLAIFSVGLGLPFILTALMLERAGALFARSGRMLHALSLFGGVLLVCIGVLMLLGDMGLLVQWSFGFFDTRYSMLLRYM